MKKIFAVLTLLILCSTVNAQVQAIKKFLKKMYFSKDTSKRSSFVIVPVFSSAPETGVELGGSALYSFYTDTLNKNTHVSNVFGYASITTKDQTNLTLSSAYWLPGNSTHLSGAVSYMNYPFDFYGIGNATSQANQDKLGERRFKLNLEAENKFGDYLFGPGCRRL